MATAQLTHPPISATPTWGWRLSLSSAGLPNKPHYPTSSSRLHESTVDKGPAPVATTLANSLKLLFTISCVGLCNLPHGRDSGAQFGWSGWPVTTRLS